MSESHLQLLQPEDWAHPDAYSGHATPLFLIHDGGGTTFMYSCLPLINRFVYGIQNPHFATGEIFCDGVPEMGRLYAGWIRDTVAQRDFPARRNHSATNDDDSIDIIVGGWSFGGLVALEVAKQLERAPGVRVIGILAIDSIFPSKEATARPTPPPGITSDESKKTRNQIMSGRAMEEARCMVQMWTVPTWTSGTRRPRMALLKAKGYIPSTPGSRAPEDVSPLDLERGPGGTLGWDKHGQFLFEEVVEVKGHHFELFMGDKLEGTAQAMRRVLRALDASHREVPQS